MSALTDLIAEGEEMIRKAKSVTPPGPPFREAQQLIIDWNTKRRKLLEGQKLDPLNNPEHAAVQKVAIDSARIILGIDLKHLGTSE